MKERPILFSAPMIRAILNGSKTQTRRVVKLPPSPKTLGQWEPTTIGGPGQFWSDGSPVPLQGAIWHTRTGKCIASPYGEPGEQLWVRETHMVNDVRGNRIPEDERADCEILYRATDEEWLNQSEDNEGLRWAPSIHMPRWASRIQLEITNIRVERLQDCSPADAVAEGIELSELGRCKMYDYKDGEEHVQYAGKRFTKDPIESYRSLWLSINGPGSWDANSWVWVVEFRRTKP